MPDLLDKMRRAREQKVPAGGREFIIRRPLIMEQVVADKMSRMDPLYVLKRHVVDWPGMTEADLLPSGGSDPVAFSSELWEEWLQDHPDVWDDLREAIRKSVDEHDKRMEAAKGN